MPAVTLHPAAALLGIFLLAGSCESFSKEQQPPIDWHGHARIEVPLSLNGSGLPVIPVRIMGQTVMAVVDTGSNASVISPGLVARETTRGSTQMKGRTYETLDNVSVEIGQASVNLPAVVVADLPADVSLLLGTEMFLHAVVEVDVGGRTLTLIKLDAFSPPAGAPIPVQLVKSVPAIQIKVNNQERPVCAIIDTAFNSGLSLNHLVASGFALPKDPDRSVTSKGIGGEQMDNLVLIPLEVRIGAQLFQNVAANEHPGTASCDNLLGIALLAGHRLLLDMQLRRAWLLPAPTAE